MNSCQSVHFNFSIGSKKQNIGIKLEKNISHRRGMFDNGNVNWCMFGRAFLCRTEHFCVNLSIFVSNRAFLCRTMHFAVELGFFCVEWVLKWSIIYHHFYYYRVEVIKFNYNEKWMLYLQQLKLAIIVVNILCVGVWFNIKLRIKWYRINWDLDNSYPGQLVPKTTRTQDNSYTGQLVPKTIRTQGTDIHSTNLVMWEHSDCRSERIRLRNAEFTGFQCWFISYTWQLIVMGQCNANAVESVLSCTKPLIWYISHFSIITGKDHTQRNRREYTYVI